MKRNGLTIIYVLLLAFCSYSQDSISTNFQNQKHFVDSLMQAYKNITFQKQAIAGNDKFFHTYKGYVLTDASNIIRSIDLVFDSSTVHTTLFCIKDTIIGLIENDKQFYKVKSVFYTNEGIKASSQQYLKKFVMYEEILNTIKTLFKPD
ncbi:MAG: hypothetical protein IT249_11665 [Chitinophagaceae bacterium]|nr:hypothetical protein [Chitinophagaceae bacterium]